MYEKFRKELSEAKEMYALIEDKKADMRLFKMFSERMVSIFEIENMQRELDSKLFSMSNYYRMSLIDLVREVAEFDSVN